MKKKLFILLLLISTVFIYAEGLNLGDFPVGKWLDANWDATWEFNSDNIRILDENSAVVYDFNSKTIRNFKLSPSISGLKLSFRCDETGKNYEFVKGLTNLDLEMTIDTDSGIHYEVILPKQ